MLCEAHTGIIFNWTGLNERYIGIDDRGMKTTCVISTQN